MELHALTPIDEINLRIAKIRSAMAQQNLDAILITDNANIYYVTGRVINGYVYLPADGDVTYFIRRPVELKGDNIHYIRKPEQIAEYLKAKGIEQPRNLGLELSVTDYMTAERLSKLFPSSTISNASQVLRVSRAVKTPFELEMLRRSGVKHAMVYKHIPNLYQDGMSDIELQIEIERASRLEGCLGQFRISGGSMELFMCNILTGENADTPTPYDFAMGGGGLDPSLPVGANGTIIKPGMTVMVDANGNFTGYMTDMTRVFSLGNVEPLASEAHECSIKICRELEKLGIPSTPASQLYERAIEIVTQHGLEHYFMGHAQKAGFIGHGVGIEINELPVIAPRSKDILQLNNVIAIEPKFVIPQVGAVGIENTYIVTANGLERITNAPEHIISLD